MQNAYERFGTAKFTRRTKDSTTSVRAHVDRAILEPAENERCPSAAHLVSMIGGDSEIRAFLAAITEGAELHVELPERVSLSISLGAEAQCFHGSIAIPGRKIPARHLVALSAEFVKTKPGIDAGGNRTILCDRDPMFVFYRIAFRYGLPVAPEWAPWFQRELDRHKAITPLLGLGCEPVLVKGDKHRFLKWIAKALKHRIIQIPEITGAVCWRLPGTFLDCLNPPEPPRSV